MTPRTTPGITIGMRTPHAEAAARVWLAIDALEPIADELERIGGSRAQLDLVTFTLLKAYLNADRPDDARRLLRVRRSDRSGAPVAGLAAMH